MELNRIQQVTGNNAGAVAGKGVKTPREKPLTVNDEFTPGINQVKSEPDMKQVAALGKPVKAADGELKSARDVHLPLLPKDFEAKVFLVHGSHTGGHRSAAESVKKVMDELPQVDAQVINALDFSGGSAVKSVQVASTDLLIKKMSGLRGWAFEKSFEGNPVMYWLGNTAMKVKSFMSKSFLNKIKEEKPDVILATHSPMNSMLSYWKGKGLLGDIPVHSVVTDFRAHRMWAQKNIEKYYVASEGTKGDLVKFGIDPKRIEVTGIPIKPDFANARQVDKTQLKKEMGIDPDKPMVLMMGGSLGLGRYDEMAKALDKVKTPVQMVCITGKNEKKKEELEKLSKNLNMPMKVVGYSKQISKWMDACDVIVSKAGGLTTSEIFAKKIPMIIIKPEPGLEDKLIPSITQTGGAFQVDTPDDGAAMIEKIIDDPDTSKTVAENLKNVGKPWSAFTVTNRLMERVMKSREK